MSAQDSAHAHQRIGHYRVLRQIGEGGMGVVYEAVRDDIGIRAAVKVLRPEFARHTEIAARFFNEARAANMIQHPGIVKVFDYGHLPTGEAYLAMEFLDGDSLRKRLEVEVRFNEVSSMRIARQIASALASAHAKLIVHRDLKPENVMIVTDAETPGGERVKILDFGIAKLDPSAPNSVRTRTNSMMGTPIYMAPEQCRGIKQIDDRADVYALGVMMFEMLAGQPPFLAEAPGDLIGMHMFKPPPTLRSSVPDIDAQLNGLVDVMLGKDPSRRPSMADVAMQLKQLGQFVSNVLPMRVVSSSELLVPTSGRAKGPSDGQRHQAPKSESAPSTVDIGSVSGRIEVPQEGPRGPAPTTEPGPLGSELERALAPTLKAPLIRVDRVDGPVPKSVMADSLQPQPVRITAKAAAQAKVSTAPLGRVSATGKPVATDPKDESTELLPASEMPAALHSNANSRASLEAETAPAMNRAEMRKAQDAYIRAKAASVEPITAPRMSGIKAKLPNSGHGLLERLRMELAQRWSIPEQRLGILIFGGLVVLGAILGILVLALGGQGT